MTELHYQTLLDVSARIRRRETTSEAVTRAALERIAAHDKRLNAVLMLLGDTALRQAAQADKEIAAGQWRGPLHGVPVGIKDIYWTEGLPTTAGMEIMREFRPTKDATVVKRLKQAGAVLIAKLHTTEGATLSHHPSFPRPSNPWSTAHWTGVSSSGSGVAVAAGYCYGALGTDTGGSIRMPSSANNLTGIKPTWGRVSRFGLMHLSETLDHIGPLCRSAGDAAAVLQAIAGADADDPTALTLPVPDYLADIGGGVSDLTIGVDWKYTTGDMPAAIVEVMQNAVKIFADLGARIREIKFPEGGGVACVMPLMQAEAAAVHGEHFPAKANQYGPYLRKLVEGGLKVNPVSLVKAYHDRDRFTGRLQAAFQDVDLILTPGLGMVLPTWAQMDAAGDEMKGLEHFPRFTPAYNLAGNPTISLPGGFTSDGLPIGIQLAAWKLEEPMLIRAGAAFQSRTDFHTRHPAF
jgi:amidase